MTYHIIRVIRQRTDTGSVGSKRQQEIICFDTHASRPTCWKPNTDIFEEQDNVIIRVELAGVKRDHISLVVKSGKLVISGKRVEERSPKVTYHQLEMPQGEFRRVISIPESIEHNEMDATFGDGILTIRISKRSDAVEVPILFEAE